MQNQGTQHIRFVNGEVVLWQAAYHELRMFCLRHGETDLPEFLVNDAMGIKHPIGEGGITGTLDTSFFRPGPDGFVHLKFEANEDDDGDSSVKSVFDDNGL